ncbi:hypothetical protein DND90_31065 [Pseudomonas syringae pv. maculicola]|nr:hypothetical protein DND90_31065 [Pseudomonas syringae pv. maculicola]
MLAVLIREQRSLCLIKSRGSDEMSQCGQRIDFMCKQLASKFSTSNLFKELIAVGPFKPLQSLWGRALAGFSLIMFLEHEKGLKVI